VLNKNLFILALTGLFTFGVTGCGNDSEPVVSNTENTSAIEHDASPKNDSTKAAETKTLANNDAKKSAIKSEAKPEGAAESADMSSILNSINAVNSDSPMEHEAPIKEAKIHAKMADHSKPHFSYSGTQGPEHWGELDAAWATCKAGNRSAMVERGTAHQSPVNFSGDTQLVTLVLTGADKSLNFSRKNNGHTIQLNENDSAGDVTIELRGVTYTLTQFHFHAGSEHNDHGKQTAMEVHFVFVNEGDAETTRYAVVGLFIDAGKSNPALAKALGALLPKANHSDNTTISIKVAKILHDSGKAYRYNGSFTTPPCTEDVQWTVMAQHATLGAAEIKAFTDLYSDNFRPLQGSLN